MEQLEYRPHSRLVTQHPGLAHIFTDIRSRIAAAKHNLVIQGESGTGKEGLAQAVHWYGPRRNGPFIAINCSAIPETLAETELFGHEKGSFTGAVQQHKGKFEQAHSGTIFLDEVVELSPANQARLLRVLQEHKITRIGSNRERSIDVRVISATHRDIKQLAHTGQFREDLFFRLGFEVIQVPPLRERPEDILFLWDQMLAQETASWGRPGPVLTLDAQDALVSYPWPGNVRELQGVVAQVTSHYQLVEKAEICREDLPSHIRYGSCDPLIRAALSDPVNQAILSALQLQGELSVAALMALIGNARYAVHRRLNELAELGLLQIERHRGRSGSMVMKKSGVIH